jgi:predicted aldo/keto reductase-like oxidoreductase
MMKKIKANRREFLKKSSLGFLGTSLIVPSGIPMEDKNKDNPRILEYRRLGRTGFEVSDISSGKPENESVLRALITSGVNFIDTAEGYENGQNERMIGRVIKDFDRKSLFINTKYSPHKKKGNKKEVIARFHESLERLQTDYIDGYMIHGASSVEMIKDENFHAAVDQLKKEGKLKHAGISCHGSTLIMNKKDFMEDIMLEAVSDGRYDLLLFVYNFLHPGMGKEILNACRSNDIGTVIMKSNPVHYYGELVKTAEKEKQEEGELPPHLASAADNFREEKSRAEDFVKEHNFIDYDQLFRNIATQFVLNDQDVNTVLMTFRNFTDLETYLNLSGSRLSQVNGDLVSRFKNKYGHMNCRLGCGICEPYCPHQVPVNTIMRYNYYFTSKSREKHSMQLYRDLKGKKAELCISCEGLCQHACPYKVSIKELLMMAHNNLSMDDISIRAEG